MMMVFELAKELGIESLALVDKLKGAGLKVKNHMTELSSDDVAQARVILAPKAEPAAAKKASRPRTGAAKPAAAKTASKTTKAATPQSGTGAVAAEAVVRTTTRRAAASKATSEVAHADPSTPLPSTTAETPAAATQSAGVIRRRIKADGQTETLMPVALVRPELVAEMNPDYAAGSTESVAQEHEQEIAEHAHHHGGQAESVGEVLQAEAAVGIDASALTQPEPAPSEQLAAAEPAPDAGHTQLPHSGGESVLITSGPGPSPSSSSPAARTTVLPPRPQAPLRRNVLSIVSPSAPPPRPMIRPTAQTTGPGARPTVGGIRGVSTQDQDGFRIIRMTKENLDQMAEDESAKKRGGARETIVRPEDVRFADYRKKEMVFLPRRKRIPVGKEVKQTQLTTAAAHKRVVEMGEMITVQDLGVQLGVKSGELIRKLMGMGQMVTINQAIDFDTATLIANEYQFEVKNVAFKEEEVLEAAPQDTTNTIPRPPVVTIMGHVDHGKTSLLDAIREANVAAGEAGGITQHIGAYTVTRDGRQITFIDTPGHEAFTTMRARGANVTDIVILVVAADDGVMPQTREALAHAKAAGVPIIVAVNKIDKPGANPEKIKQGLAELDLLAEDWGGQTMFVPVSAIKRTNLDKLLEAILLQAEVLELKADPSVRATGTVLEARLEKGRGPVVSLLIRRGTLQIGDAVVAGTVVGRVKAMTDYTGKSLKTCTPGVAVEILGFESVPPAGEKFDSPADEAGARQLVSHRQEKIRAAQAAAASGKVTLDDLFAKIKAGSLKELGVILKADVFGSVEAVRESLVKLSNDKIKIKVLHAATGGITESDVLLATASKALIIGFNVRPETKARQVAESEHIEIKCYNIIYELIDDVKKAMVGLLDKKKVETFLGRAEVRQTFVVPKIGTIAGSAVIDGKILRGASVRLLRDSRIIFEGKMHSLKRFKDDAKEVAQGYECGIGIENFNDIKPGDVIEAFQIDFVAPELNA